MLSVAQIAERLGMSQAFVRREIRFGRLSAMSFGRSIRVSETALQAYLTASAVGVAAYKSPANDNRKSASCREASERLRALIG